MALECQVHPAVVANDSDLTLGLCGPMQVFKPHEEKDQEERAKVRLNPLSHS